ncbi:uncharacterized protein G2W53_009459 [Senna tora]|uniref:DUF599 domain-containing protein n=1 Tax=Senna tora TaxID=362788 RepID=A0A835C9Z3_9FABA|nr:uncharacterized protein G2W53_009459 [Senna tora]
MEEERLDIVLVSLGLLLFGSYHVWLLCTILRNPFRTVIGLNAESRHQWVLSMMNDPLKNGVLAIQTIRNNIMASTLLATTALTLSSIIGIFASSTWNSDVSASMSVHDGNNTSTSSIKRLSISICFLVAFLCNVQSIRYYAHVSFLITSPALGDKKDYMEYTAKILNRGSHSWSLGLRAFYLSFPLFLWIYGPIAMVACCFLTCSILYFLDTTTKIAQDIVHNNSFKEERQTHDIESDNNNKDPNGDAHVIQQP